LNGVKLGGVKSNAELAALDCGILKVALMIAALDGEILPVEYAAFEPLVEACRGRRTCDAKASIDKLLTKAGRVLVMAQVGTYSVEQRLAAFRELAREALPNGFKDGSMADLRRAFALWQVMAMSDGEVSDLERQALKLLLAKFAGVTGEAVDPTALLEADFLAKVEEIVGRLAAPATREAAQDELYNLVTTITLQDGSKIRNHESSRVMVATLLGIVAAMSALGGRVP